MPKPRILIFFISIHFFIPQTDSNEYTDKRNLIHKLHKLNELHKLGKLK